MRPAARSAQRGAQLARRADRPHARDPRSLRERARRLGERVEQREQLGRALGDRVALACDRRLVAARDRAGEGALGAERAPSSRRSRARAGRARRGRRRARGEPLGGGLERDEEVRGDRGGGVVGGAVRVGDLDRRRGRGGARARSATPRAWAVVPATAAEAPASRAAPSAGTVISGCSENASCGASASSVVAPEQWPTRATAARSRRQRWRSRRPGRARSTTSASGRRAPRPSGPSTSSPASRRPAASARPRRPAPTIAQRMCARAGRWFPFQFPHGRYRSASMVVGGECRKVRPQQVTAAANGSRRGVRIPSAGPMDAAERREQLKQVYLEASACTRCALAETRTTVVFGAGNADADLMFVGEAPGANEDKQGLPFVGQAGRAARQSCSARSGSSAPTSSSRTCSSAARPATATRARRRSSPAATTCTARST